MDTSKLRAVVFERSGIAIDEHDPIMAVLIASAQQTEEIGTRLLECVSPLRIGMAVIIGSAVFAAIGIGVGWILAKQNFDLESAKWISQQSDPHLAALLMSDQGHAAIRLAELGVAELLVKCNGRHSWQIKDEYCIPATMEGRPDGFRIRNAQE